MKRKILILPWLFLYTAFNSNGQIYTPEINVTSSTNGNVGIGTSTPARNLEIFGINPALIINDSGTSDPVIIFQNAGTSKFSLRIDESNSNAFEIRSSNNSSRFLIQDGGFVGIGTTNPQSLLDIQQGNIFLSSSNQAISDGTDLNGLYWYVDDNSAGRVPELAAAIKFKGTGTWNSSVSPSVLSFETLGAAGGGTIPRMIITNSGKVGIGTTNPNELLQVDGGKIRASTGNDFTNLTFAGVEYNRNYSYLNQLSIGGRIMIQMSNASTKDVNAVTIISNGNFGIGTTTPSYKLDVNGEVRANNVAVSSDLRLKENITPLMTNDLRLMTGFQYNLKSDGSFHYGVIAQEVEEIFPHMVSTDDQGMKSVAYNEFIPLLIEKVKEQDEEIQIQQTKISQLENRLQQLEKTLIQSKSNNNE